MNKKISVYDNSLPARTYISYIAEQAGGIAIIGRDGKLYIRKLGEDIAYINKRLFSNVKWGELFKISRVAYEDGIQSFKHGTTEANTLWISQDNMYIIDQEQIDNIFEIYNGMEVYGFEGHCVIDPAIDVGDLVVTDEKTFIFQGNLDYGGKFVANIASKIQSKDKEDTTIRTPSQKTINRRVESRISQDEGKIEQLVQETAEHEQKLTTVEQNIDSIKQTVQDTAEYKRHVEGYTQIHLTDSEELEALKVEVKGHVEYNNYLFPRDDLYPMESLCPNMEGSEL